LRRLTAARFPYTTLFRSRVGVPGVDGRSVRGHQVHDRLSVLEVGHFLGKVADDRRHVVVAHEANSPFSTTRLLLVLAERDQSHPCSPIHEGFSRSVGTPRPCRMCGVTLVSLTQMERRAGQCPTQYSSTSMLTRTSCSRRAPRPRRSESSRTGPSRSSWRGV